MRIAWALLVSAVAGCGHPTGDMVDAKVNPGAASLAYGTAPPAMVGVFQPIPTFTVEVRDANGEVITSDNATVVTLTGVTGTVSGMGAFKGNVNATVVGGVATFAGLVWPIPEMLTFDVAATGVTGIDDTPLTVTGSLYTKMVVGSQTLQKVAVFDINANGDVAAERTITGTNTTLNFPWGLGYDELTNEILVSNYRDGILRFPAATANGDIAPTNILDGGMTMLDETSRISFDYLHDEMFVGQDSENVLVFSRTAANDTAPLRKLAGLATMFDDMDSVAIDYATSELYMTGFVTQAILVFDRTANGNVAPKRFIKGAATLLDAPFEIAIDYIHHELIVIDGTNGLLVFPMTATGNVAPIRRVSGTNAHLQACEGLAFNPQTDEVFVACKQQVGVAVFNRTDNGNVAPKRFLNGAGGNTQFQAGMNDIVLIR